MSRPADEGIRLQVYLARCGLGSRRKCETFIQHGRVTVNGTPVTQMGAKVLLVDIVTLDGRKIAPSAKRIYIALHKPRGYICANSDPQGRPLASALFTSAIRQRLFHVGRLDFMSSGLILYTNDGEFAKLVAHPRSQIEKQYLVETAKRVDEDLLRQYARGIRIGETRYRCKSYSLRSERSILLTLTEGKNREIRNVFISRNIRLKRVHRLRVGPVSLKGLAPARFRRLTEKEVRWFFDHGSDD